MSYAPDKFGFVPLQLGGPAQVQLEKVLTEAFDSTGALSNLLLELDQKPARFMLPGVADSAQRIASEARRLGFEGNLLLAARQSNPGNVALQTFAAKFFRAPVNLTDPNGQLVPLDYSAQADFRRLERVVVDRLKILNMQRFLERYTAMSRRVCKVEVQLAPPQSGTGFLVGPNVVLTNYHVIEDLLIARGTAASVKCRFDYLGDERSTGTAKDVDAVAAFPVAWARPSAVDSLTDDGGAVPDPSELDYALLQLAESAGDEQLLNDGTTRGYQRITDAPDPATAPAPFAADSPLLIVQHPDGNPLSLAIDTNAVIGLNGNDTRLRYRTNTEGGSSGSPCCTLDMVPIALHHAGDPKYAFRYKPKFNQGVPLHLIVKHIQNHFPGAAALLG